MRGDVRASLAIAQPAGTFTGMVMLRAFAEVPTRPPEQYERVELLRAAETRRGQTVPEGSRGTVVEVLGEHEAFMVEFQQPFAALVTVDASNVRHVRE